MNFGLRPVGAIRAYAPEGRWNGEFGIGKVEVGMGNAEGVEFGMMNFEFGMGKFEWGSGNGEVGRGNVEAESIAHGARGIA